MEKYRRDSTVTYRGVDRFEYTSLYQPPYSGVISSSTRVVSNYLDGVKNPDWRDLVRNGLNASTDMVACRHYAVVKPFVNSCSFYRNPPYELPWPGINWMKTSGSYGALSYIPNEGGAKGLSASVADAKALGNFVKDIARIRTTFQGGVVLGEIREVIRMIRNPMRGLSRGVNRYLDSVKKQGRRIPNRKSPSGKKAVRQMLSDTWLEHSFGWAPLISDIEDAQNAILEQKLDQPRWMMATGYGRSDVTSEPTVQSLYPSGLGARWWVHPRETVEVIYRGQVDLGTGTVTRLAHWGLAPENFVPTVWELVPWSFLIDYFTNLGEIVTALSGVTSNLRWVSRTIIREKGAEVKGFAPIYPSSSPQRTMVPGEFSPGECSAFTRYVEREAQYTGLLVPALQFSMPSLPRQWLNIAALSSNIRSAQRALR